MAPYSDTYWFPDGTLAANIQARVFPRNSNSLAPIFADAGMTIPLANPALTSPTGVLAFFATAGDYWIHIGAETFPVSLDNDAVVQDVWYETYEHVQGVASATWVINHSMNYQPSVEVIIGGQYVPGVDVIYTDLNNLTITFSTPQLGTAILRR